MFTSQESLEPPASPPPNPSVPPPEGGSLLSSSGISPPARRSRRWVIVISAVVVIIVVASLFLTGVIPTSTSPKSGVTPSYSEAAASAQNAANGVPGGPWASIGAAALVSDAGLTEQLGALESANCSLSPVGAATLPSSLRVPAYGDFSSGQSPFWSFIYINRATPKILLVDVVNGTADALVVGSGQCAETLVPYDSISANVLNSPTVASSFWSGGGSAFVSAYDSAHPGVPLNLIMGIFGGGEVNISKSHFTLSETWVFAMTPCGGTGASAPTGKQSLYVVPFNATSGATIGAPFFPLTTTESCTNISSVALTGVAVHADSFGRISSPSSLSQQPSPSAARATPVLRSGPVGTTAMIRLVVPPTAVPARFQSGFTISLTELAIPTNC